jgi:hypothetical protein
MEDPDDTLSEQRFPEIHLGDWLDGDDPLYYFLLLAHVTDPDQKDDASDNSKNSEEQKTWEHVFSLIVEDYQTETLSVLTCSFLEQRIGFLLFPLFKMDLSLWYNYTDDQEQAAWVLQ